MLNIIYQCKNLKEVKELLLFKKENNLDINNDLGLGVNKPKSEEKKVKIINKEFCSKCGNKKRFYEGKGRSFHICDNCFPRKDGKFQNKQNNNNQNSYPWSITCPNCSNTIKKTVSEFGPFYKCACSYKIDVRNPDFKDIISKNEL